MIHDFEEVISTSKDLISEERINVLNIIIEFYEHLGDPTTIKKYSKDLIETTRKFYTIRSDDYILTIYNYCYYLDDINEPEESYQLLKEIDSKNHVKNECTQLIKCPICHKEMTRSYFNSHHNDADCYDNQLALFIENFCKNSLHTSIQVFYIFFYKKCFSL